jgi:putative transposase
MARTPRIVLPDVVHHVVSRGANRTPIFANGFDKQRYLKRFAALATEEKVLVHGYCLMDNHEHWLLTPTSKNGLARLFQRVHTWWAMWFNRKQGRSGPLLQGRFHSSPLSEDHYWTALRYVELNPKRAGMVRRAEHYEHSSVRAHFNGDQSSLIVLAEIATRRRFNREEWRAFLDQADPEHDQALRRAAPLSKPCGSAEWICDLEQKFLRRFAWLPPGRPPVKIRSAVR